MKIIFADDDRKTRGLVCDGLNNAGYEVELAATAELAEKMLSENTYDLAIIDWEFRGEKIDGIEIIRHIKKKKPRLPVIMLTGKQSLREKMTGFESGVQDYIMKPFFIPELIARIKNIISIQKEPFRKNITIYSDCRRLKAVISKKEVFLDEKLVNLNNKEFFLLVYFLENTGETLSRVDFLENVWHDFDPSMNSNTVDVHVKRLRAKLLDFSKKIKTVRGVGYILEQ